jgi:hypothetical protein
LSPFKETTSYKFQLASDAAMTQIVKGDTVTTAAYEYIDQLYYSTNYFWRVMAVEPVPSDWSATFSFQTAAAPSPEIPTWAWAFIAIGAALVIAVTILISNFGPNRIYPPRSIDKPKKNIKIGLLNLK